MTSLLQVDNLLELYQQDVDSKVIAMPEILRWQEKWKKQDISSLPIDAIQALEFCDADVYLNARKLLTILATLRGTTASSERSFSTMRRLKTYLRNTMGEQRLTSLALLSVHRYRPVDKDSVLKNML